jgi:basic membrane protein A and related proteins
LVIQLTETEITDPQLYKIQFEQGGPIMLKKMLAVMTAAALTLTLGLTGCGSTAKPAAAEETTTAAKEETTQAPSEETKKEEKKVKVGFIYVGPIGDGGYTFAHNEGMLFLKKELGVETIYKENVPEDAECEKVMKDMIDQGVTVIFGTSFGYMDHMEKVSKEFPEVKFLHCSGYKMTENMGNYFGRIEQARYLSGIVAGLKTKSNKIGYVGAFEIPEVVRGINSFTLGVRSVNPTATVHVAWTHTWYDPAKEKDAAKALLEQGCDIMAQHQDTTGPQIAAEEKGAFAIGYNSDSKNAAPKAYMTAPVWNWGPYYVNTVKAVMDGTWKAESYWGGMKDGIVALAPLTENAPAEAKAKVDEIQKKILDGSFDVFSGPIKDQTGAEKVPAGSALSDADQLSNDWFVEGVVGKIEKK